MLRNAITALAALQVPGVQANYDLDAVPNYISRGSLPVLLALPVEYDLGTAQRLFRDRSKGFESLGFSSGPRTVTYLMTHLLLLAPVETGTGLSDHLPGLIDLIDAYFDVIGADVTLGGLLLQPMEVRVEPGQFEYGGVRYHGCAFRHEWVVGL